MRLILPWMPILSGGLPAMADPALAAARTRLERRKRFQVKQSRTHPGVADPNRSRSTNAPPWTDTSAGSASTVTQSLGARLRFVLRVDRRIGGPPNREHR